MQAPWRNLAGPSRSLAISATVLLVASALGGIEAAVILILGPALLSGPVRDFLIKPFVILGYLEASAMVFSALGIVVSMICLIFYRPYLYLREKILLYRARRAPHISDEHTYFETVPRMHLHNPEEDGTPD